MKKIATLICINLYLLTGYGQKMPNTLLWKITGNGLQKPSYLYGTMHLTDERLFLLGDSLYNAIEKSDGFATEIDLQDMTGFMIAEVEKTLNNTQTLKEILNEQKFKKYSKGLSKKFNKPADKITTQDIFREKNKWITERFSKGKMTAFLDAYLYDVAHRLGKWTGGVEDLGDQKGFTNNLIDESDIELVTAGNDEASQMVMETMIKLYTQGNLNGIDSISNFSDSTFKDQLLIKRNIKMARRMDSLSSLRTMVFAVGAAHLPGNQGVIALLRKKGFIVDPVFSSKKIQAENYHVKEVAMPWVNVEDSLGYYSVQMPGKPGNVNMFGLMQMKMFFDIFNNTGFIVTSVTSPYGKKGLDSAYLSAAGNMFTKEDIQKAKKIIINDAQGLDIQGTSDDTYRHGYLLTKDNRLYMAVGYALKKDDKVQENITRFLKSFNPVKGKVYDDKIESFVDSIYAYAVDLPSKPKPFNNSATKGNDNAAIQSHIKVCVDSKSGAYFFVGINEAKPGFYIENDSTTLENLRTGIKERAPGILMDTMYMKGNNRVLEYTGSMKDAGLTMKTYYQFRGNRWYALVAMYDASKPNNAVDRFFSSFRLLDYPASVWKKEHAKEGNLSTWAPSTIKYTAEDDSTSSAHIPKFDAYDSTRSNSYSIIITKLEKYFWQNSDSILWNNIVNNSIDNDDTLLSRKNVINTNLKGVEIIKQQKGSKSVTRKRVLLAGDKFYSLIANLPAEDIRNENTDRFFETFVLYDKPQDTDFAYTSKAKLLLDDLASTDSTTRSEAKESLSNAPFTNQDLPLLQQALTKEYIGEDSNYFYNNPTRRITNAIIALANSDAVPFAIQQYPAAKGQHKTLFLEIISSFKTRENFEQIPSLLLRFPLTKTPSYQFENNLTNSLNLAAGIIEPMLPLLKDTMMAGTVIQMANLLLDSNKISLNTLIPYKADIMRHADFRYKALKKDSLDYNGNDEYIIDLMGKFNAVETNKTLREWSTLPVSYIVSDCVEMLLKNKQPVPATAINKLAADKSYRISVYNILKEYKKLALFPKAFLSQKHFAESSLFQLASDDDEPQRLVFYTQKTITFKNKKARFYFFKVYWNKGDEAYLGCTGPFNINTAVVSPEKINSNLLYDDLFTNADAAKQMKQLTDEMEEWKDEN